MALTQGTLGAGRVGLKKLYAVENEKVDKQYQLITGRVETTTQTTEVFKQFAGLGPSVETPEGNKAEFDDMAALFVAICKPVLYTKGIKMSLQTVFTDQYGKLKNMTPHLARAFVHRRNIKTADLDNSGFTDTTKGVNSEPLYYQGHSMGANSYFSNRPLAAGQVAGPSATTSEVALSPFGLEVCWKDIRRQPSARNLPMFPVGKIAIKLPAELYLAGLRAIRATRLPGTDNNDDNVIRDKFEDPILIDYYTSPTAWFARTSDSSNHGLYFLEQMAYDVEKLPLDEEMMHKWVAFESFGTGWYDAHGTWASLGA